jgi:AAA domain
MTLPNPRELAKYYAGLDPEAKREFNHLALNPSELEDTRPADPWQPFTLADAYQERPPVEYIAGGLFALPSLNIPYGAPGTLKSFWLADLLVCVSAGIIHLPPAPWITGNGAKAIPTKQNPVMWCDFDNGRRRTHDRFGALGRAHELPADNRNLIYYSMPSPWLDASDKASIGNLALRIMDHGAKLVVIDNLGVVSGDAEENSSEMARVMSGFRQLAEDTGAAVVLVHHQRKSNGSTGRAGDALRGHSSIEASLDLALLIEREDYASIVTIKPTKSRGEDVLPFSAAFTYTLKDNGELDTAKFFGVASEDKKSDVAIDKAILAALPAGLTMNKTDLAKVVKTELTDVGVNRIRDRIDQLESLKKIRASTGKNNTERIYSRA